MQSVTIAAVLLLLIGAVIAYVVPRVLPHIARFLHRPAALRTRVEHDPEPPLATHEPQVVTSESRKLDVHFPKISSEVDPAVFEHGFPNWESYGYVFDLGLNQLGSPPTNVCREWRTWARSLGGVDANATKLQLTLEGRNDSEIRIDRLEIDVTRRREPLQGIHAVCPVGGAAASPRQIYVDLDADPPRVQFVERGDAPGEGPASALPFLVVSRPSRDVSYLRSR